MLKAWRDGKCEVMVSPPRIAELSRALTDPKLRQRLSEAEARALVDWVAEAAINVDDPELHQSIRSIDPGDDYLIAMAASNSAALVSGDAHLLRLRGKIPVYSSAEFLTLIETNV